MKSKLFQNKLIVKKSQIHGYGVFAEQDIEQGDIIEECYPLVTRGKDSTLQDYYFRGGENKFVILTGFGVIYNHSERPNATYLFDSLQNVFVFKALRKIRKGEEIVVSYGKEWFSSRFYTKKEISLWRNLLQFFISPTLWKATVVCGGVYLFLHWQDIPLNQIACASIAKSSLVETAQTKLTTTPPNSN